jgi:hypothetical protein
MAGVTQINADYLNALKAELQNVDSEVEQLLNGHGVSNDPGTTSYINRLDEISLTSGPGDFDAGQRINTAVMQAGGSVYDQLQWLDKVLKDMIEEITNTVNSFHGTESLNNEAVDTMLTDVQNTISDMGNPPGSSSSGSNPNTSTAS